MTLLQLSPSLPVLVTSKGNAPGRCHFLLDYGEEHHVLWDVVMDVGGEVWWVPNPDVRVVANFSLGRVAGPVKNPHKLD